MDSKLTSETKMIGLSYKLHKIIANSWGMLF